MFEEEKTTVLEIKSTLIVMDCNSFGRLYSKKERVWVGESVYYEMKWKVLTWRHYIRNNFEGGLLGPLWQEQPQRAGI